MIDLRDFDLPLFDDLEKEQGPPANATKLKALMIESDGFLIASPEYNSSFGAVLKNAIDWASRPAPGEAPLVAFRGKVAALLRSLPGAPRRPAQLVHLRSVLGNIGVIVLPDQFAVVKAHEAFAEDGTLKDPNQQAAVEGLGRGLAEFLAKLKA